MKYFFYFTILTAALILIGCSKSSISNTNLKDKVFYGVAALDCSNPGVVINLTSQEYVMMIFEDASGNSISYQPKANTWYKMANGLGSTWVKTGSDVTPKDIPIGFPFLASENSTSIPTCR